MPPVAVTWEASIPQQFDSCPGLVALGRFGSASAQIPICNYTPLKHRSLIFAILSDCARTHFVARKARLFNFFSGCLHLACSSPPSL
ncbi:hypothetical protein BRAO375_4680017 [Bradyrhizobium sp. ORS 375]|nr:hypothetical protein BRAO375_4680017 [Bradyrhizobium sp. ORS 375]